MKKVVLFSVIFSLIVMGGSCTSISDTPQRGQAIICGSSLTGQGSSYCYVVLKESIKEDNESGCVEGILDEEGSNSEIKVCGTYTIKK